MNITLTKADFEEAEEYANLSKGYTSDRHDFHKGGLNNKKIYMFFGKLGEKAVRQLFVNHNILYVEDKTGYDEGDNYDFLVYINGTEFKVDVKTRTKLFHTRTLEMVEQMRVKPKDLYISVSLNDQSVGDTKKVSIIGYITRDALLKINRIENLGYLDNYVCNDNELSDISILLNNLDKI